MSPHVPPTMHHNTTSVVPQVNFPIHYPCRLPKETHYLPRSIHTFPRLLLTSFFSPSTFLLFSTTLVVALILDSLTVKMVSNTNTDDAIRASTHTFACLLEALITRVESEYLDFICTLI
jgi:hypothetical protein